MIVDNSPRAQHASRNFIVERSPSQVIVSFTLPYSGVERPLDFLSRFRGYPRMLWASAGETLAGAGAAAAITASGPDRIRSIRHQAQALFAGAVVNSTEESIGPRLLGGFSFMPDAPPVGLWSAFPPALFILPRFLLTRRGDTQWLTITDLHSVDDIEPLNDSIPPRSSALFTSQRDVTIHHTVTPDAWNAAVDAATRQMRDGVLEKVVLARACEVTAPEPFNPLVALAHLDERYPNTVRFLLEPQPEHTFFGATPEQLVAVNDGVLETVALAGSARRGLTPKEDEALGEALLLDPKERHEHEIVVRFITHCAGRYHVQAGVASEPSLHRLHNIQHLRTEVCAMLAPGQDVLDAVEVLHPTPALGGLPREQALRLIEELEPQPRGWYGGPIGWIDTQGNGTFAVAIRSAISSGSRARLYAGAGIVATSDPEREWHETALKFRPMLEALSVSTDSPSLNSERRTEGEV
jgi:menaquinone-specific isochorismate synthase